MKTKTFTVTITTPYEDRLTERHIRNVLSAGRVGAVQVHEVNKTYLCDGCDKERRDVKPCGKDGNGEPDAPDLCFVCRKENAKGRTFDREKKKYVPMGSDDDLSF